jgi:hypothetical protein
MMWTSIILIATNLAAFLLLSSNASASSFYWTRGGKHCFLTSFSYLNSYFLILVFLCKCYLLISSRLSWLHGNLISRPIFSYLWDSKVLRCTCTPMFLAHIMCFLKARHMWEPDSRHTTNFLSHFCLLPKVSHANVHWEISNHTFSSHIISSSWHFLA